MNFMAIWAGPSEIGPGTYQVVEIVPAYRSEIPQSTKRELNEAW